MTGDRPEPGLYYHYKHDPSGPVNNYAYRVMGAGMHTEDDSMMVVYRPIYPEARVYKEGKMFDLRPLGMFMENVTKDGKTFPRFSKITDPRIAAQLEAIEREMYPELG